MKDKFRRKTTEHEMSDTILQSVKAGQNARFYFKKRRKRQDTVEE